MYFDNLGLSMAQQAAITLDRYICMYISMSTQKNYIKKIFSKFYPKFGISFYLNTFDKKNQTDKQEVK